jgi:protein SCO1/2
VRSVCLFLAILLTSSPVWAQTAVQRALDASRAVTAHDHATGEQAMETMQESGHEGGHADHEDPADAVPMESNYPAGHEGAGHVHPAVDDGAPGDVGVTEKLGQFIAADARFLDESGRPVTMGEIVDKPTIVVPIYFSCPNVCAIIQSSLTQVLPDVKLAPGEDFQVVSVSFDETDTPELAASQKRNYLAAMDFKYPEKGWRFLTGDLENIRKLTESLGFRFRRQGKDFVHPVVIMAVSPKGKIVRYLYGTKPLAFDLTMAATEAGKEQVGLSVKRVLAYCFSYDPEGKRYVFNFMKITATGILLILGVLLVSLLLAGRKKRTPRN